MNTINRRQLFIAVCNPLVTSRYPELPKNGAVGLNLMGSAGMFAVLVYMVFMEGYYNESIAKNLPVGADVTTYTGSHHHTRNVEYSKYCQSRSRTGNY